MNAIAFTREVLAVFGKPQDDGGVYATMHRSDVFPLAKSSGRAEH